MLDDDAIPTHCHLVPGWDTAKCCPSCHGDAELGYDVCEIEVGGRTLIVCCAAVRWWNEYNLYA